MKRTIAAVVALTAFAAGAAQASDLRICVEGAYPPFSSVNESGDVVGFDIDIANALCDQMERSCKMVQTEWDGIIPALMERKCDAIIASMSITPDRMKVIDFTNKYYKTPAKFVAKEGVDWEGTNESLKGKIAGVQRGTTHHDYMSSAFPDVELRLYGTQDEAFLDLQAGRVDFLAADSIALDDGFLKTEAGEGFAFFGGDHTDPEYFGDGAGIGIRKGSDDLKQAFNDAIDAIREDGTYAEINAKYFDFDIYGDK